MIFRASEAWNLIGRARGNRGELSEAAKKYVRSKWLEVEKGFRPPVTAKQLQKGIWQEEGAIRMYGDHIEADLQKCDDTAMIEEFMFSGTCDVIHGDTIIDIKCPWDASSFMEGNLKKEYEWQLRAYMMLYEKPKAQLVYVLMDIPDKLFEDEWRRYCWNNEIIDDADDAAIQERQFLEGMYYYEQNPLYTPSERIKVYDLERDQEKEDLLKEGLLLGMEYYESLSLNIKL